MKDTFIESSILNSASEETGSRGLTLIAVICAVLVTGLVLAGYAYLRKRHAQQDLAATKALAASATASSTQPKGPPKAQIFVDEAMLKGDQTLVGGTIKNISREDLTALA